MTQAISQHELAKDQRQIFFQTANPYHFALHVNVFHLLLLQNIIIIFVNQSAVSKPKQSGKDPSHIL